MHKRHRHRFHILSASAAILMSMAASLYAQERTEMHFTKSLDRPEPLFRRDTFEICILGDIMMHSLQIEHAQTEDGFDFSSYFMHIHDRISEADMAIANMEFTLAGKPYTGYPCFSAPDSLASFLACTGFGIFLAANNHICDKGRSGMERTISVYRRLGMKYGIRFTGIAEDSVSAMKNHPLFVRRKGISVALVNFTYGTNITSQPGWPVVNLMDDREGIGRAMLKAKDADFTIVLPHWGTEYSLRHSGRQEEEARWLADSGADIIIGTHPHVIQDFQEIRSEKSGKTVPVAYSLGNAVSNMSAENTQLELMATIRTVRDTDGDLRMLPVKFTYLWCSRPGGYCDSYSVIPVSEFIGRRNEWKGPSDYDKMIKTYRRVMRETGIKDSPDA